MLAPSAGTGFPEESQGNSGNHDVRNAALITAGAALVADIGGALFGKHQTDTAQQRQVSDMIKAGRNPMWLGAGSGAQSVSITGLGQDVSQGINSALAVDLQEKKKAEIGARIESLVQQASATHDRNEREDLMQGVIMALRASQTDLNDISTKTKTAIKDYLIQQAKANATNADTIARLNALEENQAQAESDLAGDLGEWGPAGDVLLKLISGLNLILGAPRRR